MPKAYQKCLIVWNSYHENLLTSFVKRATPTNHELIIVVWYYPINHASIQQIFCYNPTVNSNQRLKYKITLRISVLETSIKLQTIFNIHICVCISKDAIKSAVECLFSKNLFNSNIIAIYISGLNMKKTTLLVKLTFNYNIFKTTLRMINIIYF